MLDVFLHHPRKLVANLGGLLVEPAFGEGHDVPFEGFEELDPIDRGVAAGECRAPDPGMRDLFRDDRRKRPAFDWTAVVEDLEAECCRGARLSEVGESAPRAFPSQADELRPNPEWTHVEEKLRG